MRKLLGSKLPLVMVCLGCVTACVPEQSTVAMGQVARAMAAGDLNGDGLADLVVASLNEPASSGLEPEQLVVRLGQADGTFGEPVRSPGPYLAERMILIDVNGDSRLDAITPTFYGSANVFLGDGAGRFTTGGYGPGCERTVGVSSGDLNGDTKLDLAVLCRDEGTIYVVLGLGDGAGNFAYSAAYSVLPSRATPYDIDVADLNGDSKLDFVVVGNVDGEPRALVHLNAGNAQFGAPAIIPSAATAVALVDVDANGTVDLVSAGSSLLVQRGNGDGTFQAAQTLASGLSLADLSAVDVNDDGRIDLLASDASSVHALLQGEDGTFSHAVHATGSSAGRDIATGDFNGDGRLDAASLNRTSPGSVNVFFNAKLVADAGANAAPVAQSSDAELPEVSDESSAGLSFAAPSSLRVTESPAR